MKTLNRSTVVAVSAGVHDLVYGFNIYVKGHTHHHQLADPRAQVSLYEC